MDINTNEKDHDGPKLLRRATQGRIFGGVAAGLASYFELDVTLVRVVLVALAFVGGAGVPLYLAAWVLVPEEGANTAIADGLSITPGAAKPDQVVAIRSLGGGGQALQSSPGCAGVVTTNPPGIGGGSIPCPWRPDPHKVAA
jgi:phage shock protein PspC (stress-responsive transcriptional regulator)